jgi:hypothetical protein
MSEIVEVVGVTGTPQAMDGPTQGRRFTPAFQTSNNDASIGADGVASAMYWIVGAMLYAQGFFQFAGAGLSPGTGDLQLPLPPGFTLESLNLDSMPLALHSDGPPIVDEAVVPVVASGELAGVTGVFSSEFTFGVVQSDPVQLPSTWIIDGIAGVTDGDTLVFSYALPIR